MLVGVRYDDESNFAVDEVITDDKSSQTATPMYRVKAEEFYRRCKLLKLIETNKITLIQVYLLMSVHEEGPEGPANARMNVSKAGILCTELALHNFAANNSTTDGFFNVGESVVGTPNTIADRRHLKTGMPKETPFRLSYNKGLLSRIFWTSFVLDRMIGAAGTAVFYNERDFMIDEPQLEDFGEGPVHLQDFQIFKRWFSLARLAERIVGTSYRPPKCRVNDPQLEHDLVKWETECLNDDDEPNLTF
ncbi:unnamed protein product [Ambrosiozyma monospora]|uniref:Unnamed protein product n=1 Tax=Ambrosiozyma monospora TaxID=43982 RepID=A0ACB5U942_AMBMO|nr:unnamed protein product [Ambrosiozyma monospora]